MSLRKFRSIDEMKKDPHWLEPGDPAILTRMRYLGRLAAALSPFRRPRGVRRFRSIEEADAGGGRFSDE